jgi:hypothetical protein
MIFKFVRIKVNYLGPDEPSFWVLWIDSEECLKEYLAGRTTYITEQYLLTKEASHERGTTSGHFANGMQDLIAITFETCPPNKSVIEDIAYLEVFTKSYVNIYVEHGRVLIANTQAVMPLRDDMFEIIEEKYKEGAGFPDMFHLTKSEAIKKCKISKWPEGKHFYISLDGIEVIWKGQNKWNTEKAATEAMKAYCEKNFKWSLT